MEKACEKILFISVLFCYYVYSIIAFVNILAFGFNFNFNFKCFLCALLGF